MRKPTWAAAAILAFISCQSSGPTAVSGGGTGPGGVKVTGTGSTNQPVANDPYGLPTATPIGGELPRPTPTPIPSNIPPTPSR